ncbi:acyltransferase family protein [Candidatus Latescibacterota bacterium]
METARTINSHSERLYFIDRLRIFGIASIFTFHCMRFFDSYNWHVKNTDTSLVANIFVEFTILWIMPLFFVISGVGTWFSLRPDKTGKFLFARVKRLMIPFMLGVFTITPPQVYLERLTGGQFTGTFFDFIPHYFDGWYGFEGNFAWMGLHLWYLLALFIYSIIMLPVFLFMKSRLSDLLSKIAGSVTKTVVLLMTFAISLIILEVLLEQHWLGMRDFGGWNLIAYIIYYLFGVTIASNSEFFRTLEKLAIIAFMPAIVITFGAFAYILSGGEIRGLFEAVIRVSISGSIIIVLLGFGRRFLDGEPRYLNILNEAVLPFYILHQFVIIIVGYFVVQTSLSILLKFIVISALSLSVILSLFIFAIRPFNTVRFLFGMKLRKKEI